MRVNAARHTCPETGGLQTHKGVRTKQYLLNLKMHRFQISIGIIWTSNLSVSGSQALLLLHSELPASRHCKSTIFWGGITTSYDPFHLLLSLIVQALDHYSLMILLIHKNLNNVTAWVTTRKEKHPDRIKLRMSSTASRELVAYRKLQETSTISNLILNTGIPC